MNTTTTNNNRHGLRAPKGGCTVNGRVFKGGQFCLPFDPANPHGVEVVVEVAVVVEPVKVAITGFVYTVSEIPAGECGSVAFSMLKLDTNNRYNVILDSFGEVTCDCPDFEFRRAGTGRPCKHGRKLIEVGMIPAPTRQAASPIATPARTPRPRRFVPSLEEMRQAAQMFADLARN